MSIIIKTEFTAGTTIREAVSDALRISSHLRVIIQFSFNGYEMTVNWMDDQLKKEDEYNDWLKQQSVEYRKKYFSPSHK